MGPPPSEIYFLSISVAQSTSGSSRHITAKFN